MAARPSSDSEPLTSFGMPPPRGVARSRSVISISPRSESIPPNDDPTPTSTAVEPDSGVFLAPRVIDQRAFDELAATLRDLVEEAAAGRENLAAACARAERGEICGKKVSLLLQDRLRLSARMLKAFQSQIERLEGMMSQLVRRSEEWESASPERKPEAMINLEAITETLERKMFERMAEAVAHIEIRLETKARELAAQMSRGAVAPADAPEIAVGTELNPESGVSGSPPLKFQEPA